MRTIVSFLPALACAVVMLVCMRRGHGGHSSGCEQEHPSKGEDDSQGARGSAPERSPR